MLLKTVVILLSVIIFALSTTTAKADVIEGEKARTEYENAKGKSAVLIQKKKKFYFQENGGKKIKKPKSITIKVGQPLFIINDEKKIVHNVFDESDSSWVLKKQAAGEKAYTIFNEPGVHKLRCAIHPKMKVTVNVVD